MYLRCFTSSNPKKWVTWLSWVEYCYNTSMHSATKKSPFEIVYGRLPPTLLCYVPGTAKVAAVEDILLQRDVLLREVRQQLQQAQNRMKQVYDKGHQDRKFLPGDWVYLRLQWYRQQSVARRSSQKLSPKFFGPYRILAKVGTVAYKLALPAGAKIHNVFHVSLLKQWIGEGTPVSADLPLPHEENTPALPQAILEYRNQQGYTEVLVHWVGYSPADATWESLQDFQLRFPFFTLEDKGNSKGEGMLRIAPTGE